MVTRVCVCTETWLARPHSVVDLCFLGCVCVVCRCRGVCVCVCVSLSVCVSHVLHPSAIGARMHCALFAIVVLCCMDFQATDEVYEYATATGTLRVTDVHKLQHNASSLAIRLGTEQAVQLIAVDSKETAFPSDQCPSMNPRVTVGEPLVEVTERTNCVFSVRSVRRGRTTLHFAVTNAMGHAVAAQLDIVVFSEEVVVPREMALRPGVTVELGFQEGLPGAARAGKRFDSTKPGTASVDAAGAVTAHAPGRATVTASWRSDDVERRQHVEVVVVRDLTGVRVNTPDGDRVVRAGDVFAVAALAEAALPDLSGKRVLLSAPFFARPGLTMCMWSVDQGALEVMRSDPTGDAQFVGRFRARAAGPARITVRLQEGAHVFERSLDVMVRPRAAVLDGLRLPTFTAFALPTGGVSYALPEAGTASVLLSGNVLQTQTPTVAVVDVAYDGSDARTAVAVNVVAPRHILIQSAGGGGCPCPGPMARLSGSVMVPGAGGAAVVTLLDHSGTPLAFFSEDDMKVISSRSSVATGVLQRAEGMRGSQDGGRGTGPQRVGPGRKGEGRCVAPGVTLRFPRPSTCMSCVVSSDKLPSPQTWQHRGGRHRRLLIP